MCLRVPACTLVAERCATPCAAVSRVCTRLLPALSRACIDVIASRSRSLCISQVFSKGQESMYNVFHAWSVYNREVFH